MSRTVRFADPFWLVLLPASILPVLVHRRRRRLSWPTLDGFAGRRGSWAGRLAAGAVGARGLAIACMVLGLARPQTAGEQVRVAGRGVAIGLLVDRSSSMKTEDFPGATGEPPISRLAAAKATLAGFLADRTDDLIGVVGFANLPDTAAEPTLDRRLAWEAIRDLRPAGAADDGTDLGGAIAWGLGLIRPVAVQHRVLILLTDGRHAPGSPGRSLDPVVAAEVARGLGVTLHTVAIGRPPEPKPEPVSVPRPDARPTDSTPAAKPAEPPAPTGPVAPGRDDEGPDRELLRTLARRGNGRAFAATDRSALEQVFAAINALETSPVEGTIRTVYRERFAPFVLAALGLVTLDFGLRSGRLRRLP